MREVTTAEVTTGSVGESTAASSSASAQLRSGKSALAASPSSAIVIGIAITSARATGLQCRLQQLALDEHAVGEEREDQRQLDQLDDRLATSGRCRRRRRGEQHPQRHREHRGREHRPLHHPRERRDRGQQPTEDQNRVAEADVHPSSYMSLDQELGNLHGVGRGALAQVVAGEPEVEGALLVGVAADAADEDVVAAGGVERHRVPAVGGVVDDDHAGRLGEQGAAVVRREVLAGAHVDRLRVAADHRHPGAGGGDRHLVAEAEDLARLGHHLALLGGVVVAVLEDLDLGQHVEGDLVRVDLRRRHLLARQRGPRLGEQLLDRPLAGAGDRLVAGDDEALEPDRAVDRRQRHHHHHRRAVGVGDDALVAGGGVGVDPGDDQRHVLVHAPVAGVVDDDRAGLDQLRRPLGADRAAGRGEHDVDALDRLRAERPALQRRPVPLDLAPGRALGGKGDDLGGGEVAFGEDLEDGRADRAGRAQDPDSVTVASHLI